MKYKVSDRDSDVKDAIIILEFEPLQEKHFYILTKWLNKPHIRSSW